MPGNPHPIPLATWSRPMVIGVVMAYRTAHANGLGDVAAWEAARTAYVAAAGALERSPTDMPLIVSAAIRDHCDWFWRPVRARVEREERYWRGRGILPPPMNRATWPEIS